MQHKIEVTKNGFKLSAVGRKKVEVVGLRGRGSSI